MCKVKCEVLTGVFPGEQIALITTVDGSIAEVSASPTQFTGDSLKVWKIGEKDGNVLIELPREASNGAWRVWVNRDQLSDMAIVEC